MKNQKFTDFERIAVVSGLRPAYPLNAPALLRHNLYRKPEGAGDEFIQQVKNVFAAFILKGSQQTIETSTSPVEVTRTESPEALGRQIDKYIFEGRRNSVIIGQTFTLKFKDESGVEQRQRFRVRLRFDSYTENFALTLVIDRFRFGKGSALETADNVRIAQFLRKIGYELYKEESATHDRAYTEGIKRNWACFFDTFWDTPKCPAILSLDEIDWLANQKIYENRCVIQSAAVKGNSTVKFDPKVIQTSLSDQVGRMKDDATGPIYDWFQTQERQMDLYSFLLYGEQPSDPQRSRSELSLCYMLDRQVLVGLVPPRIYQHRPDVDDREDNCAYEAYFIVDGTADDYQFGRLMRRLNVMGELRSAALVDYDLAKPEDSKTKNYDIKSAAHALDALSSGLDAAEGELYTNETEGISESDAVAKRKILVDFLNDMAAINAAVPGDLFSRLTKSEYYVESLTSRLDDLREDRIEGWQTYSEYLRRYVFQVFSRISSIKQRFISVRRKIDRVYFQFQIIEASAYQTAVKTNTKQVTGLVSRLVKLQQRAASLTALILSFTLGVGLLQFVPPDTLPLSVSNIPLLKDIDPGNEWAFLGLSLAAIASVSVVFFFFFRWVIKLIMSGRSKTSDAGVPSQENP